MGEGRSESIGLVDSIFAYVRPGWCGRRTNGRTFPCGLSCFFSTDSKFSSFAMSNSSCREARNGARDAHRNCRCEEVRPNWSRPEWPLQAAKSTAVVTPGSRRRALNSGLIARDKIARVMQATLECREGHHSFQARHFAGNVKSENRPPLFHRHRASS